MATVTRTKSAPANKATEKAPVAEETKPETPAIDWNALPDAEEATYTRGPVRVDVEADTPQRIKEALLKSYKAYKPGENGKTGENAWFSQPCGTEKTAQEFIRLAKRYGKNVLIDGNRVTVRATVLASDKSVVRFCMKPFEARDKG